MTHGFTSIYNANSHQCEVCDSNLTYPEFLLARDLGYSVCRLFDCKRIMSQKSSMTPLLFRSHLEFNRKQRQIRSERDEAHRKHIDEVTAKELQEHEQIFQSVLNENPELSEENTHWLAIPSGNSKLAPVADERVEKYIEHIKNIVAEADQYSNASEVISDQHSDAHGKRLLVDRNLDENPGLREMSDSLCSMCKGGCCISGREHAYLSVYSMRRYLDDNPELSITEVIDLYCARIGSETIQNSCINHTSTGCALPRDLRSDICNGFYCSSLKSYHKKMAGREDRVVVLAIQRSRTNLERFEPEFHNGIIDVALIGVEANSTDNNPTSKSVSIDIPVVRIP